MNSFSLACSVLLLAAPSTRASQGAPEASTEAPARIAALVQQLEALDGPVAYTVQVHRRRLWLHGERESRVALRDMLRSWADRVADGDTPSYRDGLELFHTPLPASDYDGAAGGAPGRLVRHEYARSDDVVLHTLRGENDWTWSTLVHGEVALSYDSLRGGVRALDYDPVRGMVIPLHASAPHALALFDPTQLLGVLRTEPRYRDLLERGTWSSPDGAAVETLVTSDADTPAWRFALAFDDEGALPAAAVDRSTWPDDPERESILLSLYQRPGTTSDEGLGLLETLYFDVSLGGGETDSVWMEHHVVHARDVPAPGAAAWRLPVPVGPELHLKDHRADSNRRRLGTSLEAWPDELVEWIHFER